MGVGDGGDRVVALAGRMHDLDAVHIGLVGSRPSSAVEHEGHGRVQPSRANGQIYDELMSTGGIVAGSGTFEPAGGWGGDHHDAVPIFVLCRHPAPAFAADWPLVHYVSDLDAAMRDAKHAASDKNVLVHGAGTAQRALTSALLDELEIHLIPVLMGDGRRLFEHLGIEQRELERIRVLEGEGGVTHFAIESATELDQRQALSRAST